MIPPYSAMHQLWREAGRWVVGTGLCSLQVWWSLGLVVSVGEFCSNVITLVMVFPVWKAKVKVIL